jgi:Nif-specific regulatory protein
VIERFAGRYLLLRHLGSGGMGEVYLARDLATGAQCALKRLNVASDAGRAAAPDLMRREFEALTRVRHPSVVAVHELGFAPDGTAFYTMEYVPGIAADRALARGDWPSLLRVAAQVAQGLEALHAAGVVHGDIKPSNLLVIPPADGQGLPLVRLLDFGLAAVLGREARGHRGTPGYAAPEVVRGDLPTRSADLYGLGAMLFTLVHGRPPFEADGPTSLLRRQQAGPPSAQPLEEAGAPAPLVQLILRMLAPDPNERPRDAREVRRELERLHPAARRPLAERLRSAVVVGREKELGRLEQWGRPGDDRVRAVVVAGEAGSGKSALLGELAARAAIDGRRVAQLACGSLTGSGAVALTLLRRWAAEAQADVSAMPGLATATRAALGGESVAFAAADLGALADAAAVWIRNDGSTLPRLVLLDDAERLDPLSRAFVRRLVLHPEAPPMLWVIARRGVPSGDERVLGEAGVAEILNLGSLDAASVARLADARLSQPTPETLHAFLWTRAAGHAGLTVDLLRAAAESGALRESEAGLVVDATALAAVRVPVSFEAALIAACDALPAGARRAAEALAIWGYAVDPERVAALDPGADVAALDLLVASDLARSSDGRYTLSPPALAESLRSSMDPARRAALHARAADQPALGDAQRFHHLREAGRNEEALASATAAMEGGQDERLAADAASLADATTPDTAGAWHARAGHALAAGGRYARAIPHFERALLLARSDEERWERRHRLSTCFLRMGRLADVERIGAEALAGSPPAAVRARLLSDESARRGARGEGGGAVEAARAALALAETSGDAEVIGIAANTLARALLAAGDHAEADVLARRAAESYRAAGHGLGEVRAMGTQAAIAHARHALETAEAIDREAIATARTRGYRLVHEELLLGYAAVLVETGRWDDAREATSEAARIALEDERPTGAALAIGNLAQFDGLTGRPRTAASQARAAVRLARGHLPESLPLAWRSLAQAHRIAGRLARAERAARRALTLAMRTGPPYEVDWCRIELARTWMAAGRWPEIAALCAGAGQAATGATIGRMVLTTLAGRAALRTETIAAAERRLELAAGMLTDRAAPYARAQITQLRGEIALKRGRVREALEAARGTLETLASLPAPADRAQAQVEFARLSLEVGSDGRIPVGAWLDDAAAVFERFGDRRSRERALGLTVEWLRLTGGRGTVGARDRNLIESVSRLLDSLSDLRELTTRAMELAVEQFDAERGVLLLADPETGRLAPMAEHGAVDAATRREALTYSSRVAQRVAESGGSVLIGDAPSDPRAASESVIDLRLRSIVCVPMYLGGRVIGAVYMDHSRRPEAFSDEDRGLLEGFAHLMAVAIENSRGHEEVRRTNELLVGENLSLRQAVSARFQSESLIASSSAMQPVLSVLERAARVTSGVLITGENGTGKELIARILHHGGKRRLRPFVAVNCGAIPETLLESELFGILPHTATDVRGRDGKFVQADGGTLFLDEIGTMPLNQQVALLSALANREITPVGGSKPIPVDVRVIAATNRDLRTLVEEGRFREDLYFRLNVIPVELPPLRERKADIPSLAQHFVALFARQQEREVPELSPEFRAALMRSDWPGNVRELQNYIERVLAMHPGNVLRPVPPPADLEDRGTPFRIGKTSMADVVEDVERRMLIEALQKARGNQSVAARELGMTEQSIRYRMRKYGLPSPRQVLRIRKNLR